MAGNIYGYQGVHTPLESVTQGRYTLSDYTNMRTELTSRLIALENQGGFVPTNVEITGYLHMLPGGAGMGEIETTSSITGESLYVNSLAQCGSLECNGNLTVGGTLIATGVNLNGAVNLTGTLTTRNIVISPGYNIAGDGSGLFNIDDNTKLPLLGGTMVGSINMATYPITSTGTITASSFIGSGALLTGVLATDNTKLPLAGGTLSGALLMGANNITSTGTISATSFTGSGALLTGIVATDASKLPLAGGTMSGALVMGANNITSTGTISATSFTGSGALLTGVVASDNTKLPLAGGTLSGALIMGANNITSTGTISATSFTGSGALLTGVVGTDSTKLPLAGGAMTGAITSSSTISATSFIGSGAALTGVTGTDASKVPLAGGTMSGSLTINSPGAFLGNGSLLSTCYIYPLDQTLPTYTLPAVAVKDYNVMLNYQNSTTLYLSNLSPAGFQDKQRYLTITKIGMSYGDFTVTLTNLPPSSGFFLPSGQNLSSINMPLGVFSFTFLIFSASGSIRFVLISKVS